MRLICAIVLAVLPVASGCESAGTTTGDDCRSHYEPVADAATRADLLRELREEVNPRVEDVKVIDEHPDRRKVYVVLLSHRGRTVMSLDMWRQDDGTWTARQWSQCID